MSDPVFISDFTADMEREVRSAMEKFKPMNSAHEGYAVLLEEVDELWDEVKKNQRQRNYDAMYRECVQVAAMAARLAIDVVRGGIAGHEMKESSPDGR